MTTSRPTTFRPVRRLAAGAAVLVVLLTACGEDDTATDGSGSTPDASVSASPSEEASPSGETTPTEEEEATPQGPACAEVWVAGQVLPQRYRGCLDGEKWREAFVYPCSSGQKLVTYGRTFYAAKGEKVVESPTPLAKNPEFQGALAACGA
jgi:hypothetical protein